MHLALIPRARTTVLAILRLLEMVLIVKVSLVFEGDVIFILFPTLNVAVNCLELTFIRNSHRGGIILRYFVHKNESLFHCVLNDLTTLHELFTKTTLSSYQHYLNPFMIKLRQKALSSLQNRAFWTSKQPFTIHFFLASCNVSPVAIPEIFVQT